MGTEGNARRRGLIGHTSISKETSNGPYMYIISYIQEIVKQESQRNVRRKGKRGCSKSEQQLPWTSVFDHGSNFAPNHLASRSEASWSEVCTFLYTRKA